MYFKKDKNRIQVKTVKEKFQISPDEASSYRLLLLKQTSLFFVTKAFNTHSWLHKPRQQRQQQPPPHFGNIYERDDSILRV